MLFARSGSRVPPSLLEQAEMVATLLKCQCVWVENPVCFKPLVKRFAIYNWISKLFYKQVDLSDFSVTVFPKMGLGLPKQFCWLSHEFQLCFQTSSATQSQSCCFLFITAGKKEMYGVKKLPKNRPRRSLGNWIKRAVLVWTKIDDFLSRLAAHRR